MRPARTESRSTESFPVHHGTVLAASVEENEESTMMTRMR